MSDDQSPWHPFDPADYVRHCGSTVSGGRGLEIPARHHSWQMMMPGTTAIAGKIVPVTLLGGFPIAGVIGKRCAVQTGGVVTAVFLQGLRNLRAETRRREQPYLDAP